MKNILLEFLKLLSSAILIICFSFASFLLIINLFHYKEISRAQRIDMVDNKDYIEYKNTIDTVDKTMKSVNYNDAKYKNTAKPVYEKYNTCIKSLKESTFEGLKDKSSITILELYNINNEMLDEYNNLCISDIVYTIEEIGKTNNYKNNFVPIKKSIEEKQKIMLDNTDYLAKASLNNSSYSFNTDLSTSSIYNKTIGELKLTITNYKILASILDDIARYYSLEFGGNI